MQFRVVPRQGEARSAVEQMISAVYATEYGAAIPHFPEFLIAVFDDGGRPVCAASLREAADGFFSEQYLDRPVEDAIGSLAGRAVLREEILELGSLAASRPGALLLLLHGFANLGLASGHRWGIFTATERLRRLAVRMSIEHLDLGAAPRERVAEPEAWGRYYDFAPRVCAVEGPGAEIRLGLSRLPGGVSAPPPVRGPASAFASGLSAT